MIDEYFQKRLEALRDAGRLRSLVPMDAVGGRIGSGADALLNFSSNDYLDLANDARVKTAAREAVDEYGAGATASRLMAGDLTLHEGLETELAGLVCQPAALVFATGYQMNTGVMSGLFDESWTVFSDALNHASIVDGCRLSKARIEVYPHNDMDALRDGLSRAAGLKAVVTESVFSMDGDVAPMTDVTDLARSAGALLIVDEAHAIGIQGDGGGVCRELGFAPDITLGTLGKSLGSAGGFTACSELLRDVLINSARPFIFSTGLAPACAGAALEAIRVVHSSPGMGASLLGKSKALRERLQGAGFDVAEDASPIVPIIVGEDAAAVALSRALLARGILAKAVRPPTVPAGTSRLRVSVTLAHEDEDFDRLVEALTEASVTVGS